VSEEAKLMFVCGEGGSISKNLLHRRNACWNRKTTVFEKAFVYELAACLAPKLPIKEAEFYGKNIGCYFIQL